MSIKNVDFQLRKLIVNEWEFETVNYFLKSLKSIICSHSVVSVKE